MCIFLKRGSINVSEFSVYRILKNYFYFLFADRIYDSSKMEGKSALIHLFSEVVNFNKLTLKELTTVFEDNILPEG